jgi:N-acetylglucosamine kinase
MRDHDGRGPSTKLKPMILAHLQLPNVESLVPRVHVQQMERHEIATLARLVVEAAQQGDQVAQDILAYAGQELATAASAIIRGLKMQEDQFDIGLAGGVFRAGGQLVETISHLTQAVAPRSRVVMPRFEPAVGALLLSLKQSNGELTDQVVASVEETLVGQQHQQI